MIPDKIILLEAVDFSELDPIAEAFKSKEGLRSFLVGGEELISLSDEEFDDLWLEHKVMTDSHLVRIQKDYLLGG